MAWETRRNGRRYYYIGEKIDGRVVKRCVGPEGNETTEMIAVCCQGRRLEQDQKRRQQKQQLAEREHVASLIVDYYRQVETLAHWYLTATGYHQHNRGEWRRRRGKRMGSKKEAPMILTVEAPSRDAYDVMKRAQAGDETALPALRAILDEISHNGTGGVPSNLTDRERMARFFAARSGGKNDLLEQECLRREWETLRKSISGANPTPLEMLLVDRIIVCYMHVQLCERWYQGVVVSDLADRVHAVYLSRLEAAQRRYLAAIKALAQIRRLQVPMVNIALPGAVQNIAGQQVNFAASEASR